MKLLFLDIEISPSVVGAWGLWKQNINIDAIIGDSRVLTWAASWEGEDNVLYHDGLTDHSAMIHSIHSLLEEADYVCTYNGDRFDLKILNQEFLEAGLPPPSPYKSIDLLKTVKKNFRFTSNKLDYITGKLGLGNKIKHRGYQLWLDCMNGKKAAFKEMSEYNVQDVVLLEKLFYRLTPWIGGLNRAMESGKHVCPRCGGNHLQHRGTRKTLLGTYERLQCTDCGGWMTGTQVQERSDITTRLRPL